MRDSVGKITVLRGAERVRRRPAVIFGDNGIEGVMTAFEMLLHTLSGEAAEGCGKVLTVTRFRDASIGIEASGRGLCVADDGWKELFCELYAGSAYESDPAWEDSFHLCAVQYASEFMDVRVCRDGQEYRLRFEKGENLGGLKTAACDAPDGTYIRFKPDREVFTDICLSAEGVAKRAQQLALQLPGLQVSFREETDDGFAETVFCYPEGSGDYLKGHSALPVYTAALEAQGQERYNRPSYTARVRVGIGFGETGFVECYHNRRELTHGGTHVDKLVDEVGKYLEWMLEKQIPESRLLSRLQLVVISDAMITQWSNGARTSINNTLIRDMAQDTLGENFRQYVKENRTQLHALLCPEE